MIIETSRGETILADDADAEILSAYTWHAVKVYGGRFYAQAHAKGRARIQMHRLLMSPAEGMVVHHLNNNGLDNRRCNLAIVTHRDNLLAHHRQRPTGVHLHKQTGKWRAQSRDGDGRRVSLGIFDTPDDAYAAVAKFRSQLAQPVRGAFL